MKTLTALKTNQIDTTKLSGKVLELFEQLAIATDNFTDISGDNVASVDTLVKLIDKKFPDAVMGENGLSKIPIEKLPLKIAFWDDVKAANKSGEWIDVTMPTRFRHFEKFINGNWVEISPEEYDYLFVYNGGNSEEEVEYSRKKKMEDGKFVYHLNILAEKVQNITPISTPQQNVNTLTPEHVPTITIDTPEATTLMNAIVAQKEGKKERSKTYTIQEVIEKYNEGISEDEIKAWVWYKRRYGNPMRGFEKYFISNAKSGQRDTIVFANAPTDVLDNRFKLIRQVPEGTLLGRLTKFSNEYQGITYVIVKNDNQELLWVDKSKLREESQKFTTDESELTRLVNAKALVYCDGELLPIPVYQFGNMYEREKQLEADKAYITDTYGAPFVEYYKMLIELGKPKQLRFDNPIKSERPRISVLSQFANDVTKISLNELNETTGVKLERPRKRGQYADSEPFSLNEGFEFWLETVKDTELKNTSKYNIRNYYLRQGRFPEDTPEIEKAEIRAYARNAAEELFSEYLATALLPNDVFKLNQLWNMEYNSFSSVKGDRIPVAFECSSTFKNNELYIKPVQRNGIGFLSIVNSGCLAYDVGYGKTMSAIVNVANVLSTGRAKRCIVAVPRPTYKNWKKELFGYWTDGTNVEFKEFKGSHYVTGVLSNTQYTLNDWYNLSTKKLQELGDINKIVPENSVTLITYQGLQKIGFSKSVRDTIFDTLCNILDNGEVGTARQEEIKYSKYREMMGEGNKDTIADIDVCGFDHITVDEAHNFKNVFDKVGKNEEGRALFGIQAARSTRAIKLFFQTQYIQRKFNGNVVLLTATPFTNSPLEIYSMLSFIGFESLRKYNLQNIRRFFETFILETIEYAVNIKGEITPKSVIKGYTNKHVLQKLLYNHFDYRADPKEAGIVRPCKVNLPLTKLFKDGRYIPAPPSQVITTYLDQTEWQAQVQADVVRLAKQSGKDGSMFKAMSKSLDNALSPFLASGEMPKDAHDLVDNSPKIKYVMECIKSVKLYHEERGENVSGQVIYADRGKELFPYIREYLFDAIGFKRKVYFGDTLLSEVEIIEGGGSQADEERKEEIKEAFLKGIVKVVIGTSAIKEGVNLQTKGTVLYDMYLNWNPTDVRQLEGRIWRQGNEFGYVRIVMPLVQNSMDAFIFQKLEEKQSRINDIWGRGGANNQDEEALDPEEIKYALISDPNELVKMKRDKELKEASVALKIAEENLEDYGAMKQQIFQYTELKEFWNMKFKERLPYIEKYKTIVSFQKKDLMDRNDKATAAQIAKYTELEEKLDELINLIGKYLTDIPQNDADVFEINRIITQKKWFVDEHETVYLNNRNMFDFSKNWQDRTRMVSNFRDAFSKVKQIEKNILTPHGLSIYDDLSNLKDNLQTSFENAQLRLEHLKSEEYERLLFEEIQQELDKRASIRGDLFDQVEKFKSTNYLLSYKADDTDREACELPTEPCCPTNGYEEIIIDSVEDTPESVEFVESAPITPESIQDAIDGLKIMLELAETDVEKEAYADAIGGLEVLLEMENV